MHALRTPEDRFRDLPAYQFAPTGPTSRQGCGCTTSTRGAPHADPVRGGHFVQEDAGVEIAERTVARIRGRT